MVLQRKFKATSKQQKYTCTVKVNSPVGNCMLLTFNIESLPLTNFCPISLFFLSLVDTQNHLINISETKRTLARHYWNFSGNFLCRCFTWCSRTVQLVSVKHRYDTNMTSRRSSIIYGQAKFGHTFNCMLSGIACVYQCTNYNQLVRLCCFGSLVLWISLRLLEMSC